MRYIATLFPLALLIYMLSFAKYNWTKNNKLAAAEGSAYRSGGLRPGLYVIFFAKAET